MAEAAAETKEAKGGGGSKLVPALIIVNILLVAAVLAVFLLKGGAGGHAGAEGGKEGEAKAGEHGEAGAHGGPETPGPTTKLADFVVHLRDAEADRYARVSFEIEVGSEEDKNKLGAFMPRVRDAFIAYLSDRTLEELRGSEAIGRLKTALAAKVSELAPGVKVKALYVTDLVIQ